MPDRRGCVVIALVGPLPRAAAALSWTILIASILFGPLFGPGFKLPQWALRHRNLALPT